MKKVLLVYPFLFFTFIVNSYAETFEIGFKGGMNFSNIYGKDAPFFGQDVLIGINSGFFGELKLLDFLAFQPETSLDFKGGQENAFFSNQFTHKYSLSYLEFPMMLKAKALTFQKLKMNVVAGPYIAFLLNESYSTSDPIYRTSSNTGKFNYFDFGLGFGVSFELENII